MNRRHFLFGAGGFALAIPFLPSLLPRQARAADGLAGPKRFVCITSHHGGVWGRQMYPDDAVLTETSTVPGGGHTIRHGALVLTPEGSNNRLSACLSASASALTPSLAMRMNVLRGLDIPFYISHHTGGFLGNFARNDGEYEGHSAAVSYRPTIDQILAHAPGFYDDLSGILRRSVHIGFDERRAISWRREDPSNPRSRVVHSTPVRSSLELFDRVYRPSSDGDERRPVVDHVLEHYRQLRSGAFGDARRLSTEDRRRLDIHMDRLHELERSLDAVTTCDDVERPLRSAGEGHPGHWGGGFDEHRDFYELYNEVIAIALACDTTRVVTLDAYQTFQDYGGDWHQDVAHRLFEADRHAIMLEGQRRTFEHVFVDLCNRLMVDQGGGTTVLDDSLVMWVQESGNVTHDPISLPVITAGSAGGFFRTGRYVDYQDRDNLSIVGHDFPEQALYRPGLYYSQWLGSVLQSMGVPRSVWGRDGEPGYGEEAYDWWPRESWSNAVRAQANEIVPLLSA